MARMVDVVKLSVGACLLNSGCAHTTASLEECSWQVPVDSQPVEVKDAPASWSWRSGRTEVTVSLVGEGVEGNCGGTHRYARDAVALIDAEDFSVEATGSVAWLYASAPEGDDQLEFVSFGADVSHLDDERVPDDFFWRASATIQESLLHVGVEGRPVSAPNEDFAAVDAVFSYVGPLE